MPLAAGAILNNRYRITSLLSQGGMGAVYDAWDANLGVRCAVKENLNFTEAAQRQFEREARLLATVHHQHLPHVSDHFYIADQGQYLVMQFVEGEDLWQRLARLGQLPEADVLAWAEQILDALAYLHSRNIIHRDVKPANIRLTPEHQAMLVDFGIAKESGPGDNPTTAGARNLTPGFAPPEQYGQGRTDARSDLYALGATLYTLLTGAPPADAIARLNAPATFTPLSVGAPEVSQTLAGAIDRALDMRPEARFESAEQMRAAMKAALQVRPDAGPAGPPEEFSLDRLLSDLLGPPAAEAQAVPVPVPVVPPSFWGVWRSWVAACAWGGALTAIVVNVAVVQIAFVVFQLEDPLRVIERWLSSAPVLGIALGVVMLVAGPLIALPQWRALRRYLSGAIGWVPLSIVGLMLGTMAFIALFAALTTLTTSSTGGLAPVVFILAWACGGAIVGAAQWLWLRRRVARAGWWVPVSAVGWAVAFVVGLPGNVYSLFRFGFVNPAAFSLMPVVLGALVGTIVVTAAGALGGAITGLVLARLIATAKG